MRACMHTIAQMSADFDLRPEWKAAAYADLCTGIPLMEAADLPL